MMSARDHHEQAPPIIQQIVTHEEGHNVNQGAFIKVRSEDSQPLNDAHQNHSHHDHGWHLQHLEHLQTVNDNLSQKKVASQEMWEANFKFLMLASTNA